MERTMPRSNARRTRKVHRPPIAERRSLVTYWLSMAGARFSSRLVNNLKKWNVIPSEWTALRQIYVRNYLSLVDVVRAVGITKGGASKLIARLVKKGWVAKSKSTFDKRFCTLALTDEGEGLVQFLSMVENHLEEEFAIGIRPKSRRRLQAILRKLVRAPLSYWTRWPAVPVTPQERARGIGHVTDDGPTLASLTGFAAPG